MARIEPFPGIRYDPATAGDLESLVTPPYDLIDSVAEQEYGARNPYNIIHLDLAKKNSGGRIEKARHSQAARLMSQWLEARILIQDPVPSLYPYDIIYRLPDGTANIRKGFICLVRLAEFSEGLVLPHERTFEAVIQDRLELSRHCRAQFSQVFSLYSDPAQNLVRILEQTDSETVGRCTDEHGSQHLLRRMTDPEAIRTIQHVLERKTLYLADGHHRYATALAYRRECAATRVDFSDASPENYLCMYLSPMEDPGLTILPTHRLVSYPGPITATRMENLLGTSFEIERFASCVDPGDVLDTLNKKAKEQNAWSFESSTRIGLWLPQEETGLLLEATDPVDKGRVDTAVLNELILNRGLGLDAAKLSADSLISYHSELQTLLGELRGRERLRPDTTPLIFFMNPLPLNQLKRVADRGEVMPQKSTFFFPKIVSGLVMYLLDFAAVAATR